MFTQLINLLRPEATPDQPNPGGGPLALAALMVRLARADGHYDRTEADRITRLLAERYRLGTDAATALRTEGERIEADAPDTVRFTRALKEAVPHEDRMSVMEALWSVALADDARDAEEDALMRLVASLLGINDRDSAIARQRVQRAP